jgi:hypothetical protein
MTTSTKPLINVTITEEGMALLDPPVPLLEPLLEYRRRTFVLAGPTGVLEQINEFTLCGFDREGRLTITAGMLPRVCQVLREHGYRVRIENLTKERALELEDNVLGECSDYDETLLTQIMQNPLGQIHVQHDDDAIDKCVLIGRAFPKAQIVVAVATRKQAWKVHGRLGNALKQPVGLCMSGICQTETHLLVATFWHLPRDLAGKIDILLLPFGVESTGDEATNAVIGMKSPRQYAFFQPQRRLDHLVQLRLEQLAGRPIFLVRKRRVRVRVLMMPLPDHAIAAGINALDRKRSLIWHNSIRNKRIAEVASAVAARDIRALRRLGFRDEDMTVMHFRAPRIVILVETPEHGRKLLPLLPGWKMLDLMPKDETASPQKPTTREPVIVTAAFAATKPIRADVVIRATGTEFPMRVKGFPQIVNNRDENEALIIDLLDAMDAPAEIDTRRRVEEYQRRGMTVISIAKDHY